MAQIIAGTITIDPANTDAALAAVVEMARQSREEPGCVDYVISLDPGAPGVLRIFECYESVEAIDAHASSDHMATFRQAMAGWGITDVSLMRYEVTEMGPLRPRGSEPKH